MSDPFEIRLDRTPDVPRNHVMVSLVLHTWENDKMSRLLVLDTESDIVKAIADMLNKNSDYIKEKL